MDEILFNVEFFNSFSFDDANAAS